MYEYIVPQELNIADRLGKFTLPQWAFIATGGLIIMFMMMTDSIPIWLTVVAILPIMGGSFILALYKKDDMPIYEFILVYVEFKIQPKQAVYSSGNENFYEEDIVEESIELEDIILG